MSEIKNALSAEEWAGFIAGDSDWVRPGTDGLVALSVGDGLFNPWNADSLAAMALHEQPFGFTREDAERHRAYAQVKGDAAKQQRFKNHHLEEQAGWHKSMADRIEALLPPEENHGTAQSPDEG